MTLKPKPKMRSHKKAKPRLRFPKGMRPFVSDEVYHLLAEEYGPAPWAPRHDGVSELVACILSQHTSDLNSEKAFETLVHRYPTWQAIIDAPTAEVVDTIRNGGLAQQKGPRIQAVLHRVLDLRGEFDLDFLKDMPLDEAKAWLKQLPGVGPKTAAIVLCFAMGMPAMPVDTHIYRVSRRLGLIGPKVTADQAHDLLEPSVSPEQVFPFHVYLINHGRRVCKAPKPLCGRCTLAHRCPSRLEEPAIG